MTRKDDPMRPYWLADFGWVRWIERLFFAALGFGVCAVLT